MTRPLIYIYDVETQVEINREMNDAEYEQWLAAKAAIEAERAAQ
jgi:hypothetical protein